jgi:transposase
MSGIACCSTAWGRPTRSTGRGPAWTARSSRPKGGGPDQEIGPNPTDRGKAGSKRHVVVDQQGIPLAIWLTAANVQDSVIFEELIEAVEPIARPRGRRRTRPDKPHADKGYDFPRCRAYLRRRGIRCRIARRGIESKEKLGRYRRVAERAFAWLDRFRRLVAGCQRCRSRVLSTSD